MHSKKILSKDTIPTILDDKLFFPYNSTASKPKKSRLLTTGRKQFNGSSVEFSMILPRVEEFGSFVNG